MEFHGDSVFLCVLRASVVVFETVRFAVFMRLRPGVNEIYFALVSVSALFAIFLNNCSLFPAKCF
ncbi:MAG: hypothetical protein FD123_3769 [Bacteroidetes bacterium]|nr:MAG: hypothetical protein FD123_3769 [Bacteroidota bacterium]